MNKCMKCGDELQEGQGEQMGVCFDCWVLEDAKEAFC
jgi:DNA-directed RNA polymerase subunit RPC12/RpoP